MNDVSPEETPAVDAAVSKCLREIYETVPEGLGESLMSVVSAARQRRGTEPSREGLWDERDCVLITYADEIRDPQHGSPLRALREFLLDHELTDKLSVVHLLPFCPWTSDDGFSVVDYLQVDPDAGSWEDIAALGQATELMFDLVLNHCSQQHEWFQGFLRGESPYDRFFVTGDPNVDHSRVVRPRSSDLFSKYETSRGPQHVWTTFSRDQVDLNYAEPLVLEAMARTFVEYALRGARIIRLDAVAFLWKNVTTTSLHLKQTHAIVRLLRRMVDLAVPGTLVLTETNVPHQENISYFGDGDEAHMVYNFSLPPLLLDAMESGDTSVLIDWLGKLKPPTPQTTFFNFTASHDGIGVRPLEGIVDEERLAAVVSRVRRHGGEVSMRSKGDGTESPYELNITYIDAVADPQLPAAERARRFMTTQAFMLAMQGMPAVYFQSLIGGPSDHAGMGVGVDQHKRRINRRKFERQELEDLLAAGDSAMGMVFEEYQRILGIRRRLPAMHPNASQRVLESLPQGGVGLVRGESLGEDRAVSVLCNLSEQPIEYRASSLPNAELDYLSGERFADDAMIHLGPFQIRWIGSAGMFEEH